MKKQRPYTQREWDRVVGIGSPPKEQEPNNDKQKIENYDRAKKVCERQTE